MRRDRERRQRREGRPEQSKSRSSSFRRPGQLRQSPERASRRPHSARGAAAEGETEIREDRLEGRNPILEAIRAGRAIDKLWVLKDAKGHAADPRLRDLIQRAKAAGAVLIETERAALDRISQTHAHQGVIAQVAMHSYQDLDTILDAAEARGEKPFLLILDEIKDAYNLGAMLRIAEAAGMHAVVFPKRRAVGLDAVVAKTSAGAVEYIPCCRVSNLRQCITALKKRGVWIVGTSPAATETHDACDLSGPLALVVGSEGEGMRDSTMKACDRLIRIPMKGSVNSLNAASAASVVVFEALRQRDASSR